MNVDSPYDKIEVNHSENIVINIKHANSLIVEEVLPGYTSELCASSCGSCE